MIDTDLKAAIGELVTRPLDARVLVHARNRERANVVFNELDRLAEPVLGLAVQRGYRCIRQRSSSGWLRVISDDVDHLDGLHPTLELWPDR